MSLRVSLFLLRLLIALANSLGRGLVRAIACVERKGLWLTGYSFGPKLENKEEILEIRLATYKNSRQVIKVKLLKRKSSQLLA